MRMTLLCLFSSVFVLCLMGCSGGSDETQPEVSEAKESTPGPPPPPVRKQAERGDRVAISENSQEANSTERVEAQVGVGAKGRRLEDERLVKSIVTPAIALFRTRERVVFAIKIPHAMQLYVALNGKKPATQEEFFDQIIKANQIELPTLPEGQRYVYDPEKGELMVERPAR